MGLAKNMSLERRSVKQKLLIAFSLMSIIPLLSMAYFVTNYIFREMEREMLQVSIIVIFSLWVSWMGYLLARTIVLPLVDMANEVKKIAGGRYDANITLRREDELGDIANGVNEMVAKIRMQEEKRGSKDVIDRLTGLYTFSHMEECMGEELKRAQYFQRPCSLIILNIDDCKKYSNTHGPEMAEKALKSVANLLSGIVPPVGTLARTSSDEFGMLLPERNKREALETAEDIRKRVEQMDISGTRITVSLGVGENPIDGSDVKEVVFSAKRYLDKAKKSGKNRVNGE
ncbi:MAG: sensor domain-containing diguanylate cyclase [Candidatus Omnitrophota bacterium]|nr:sensor domain-containing diguanylate cyclase [Candidatus Omnitrophota bacterium]